MLRDIFTAAIGELHRLRREASESFYEVARAISSSDPKQTRYQAMVEETLSLGHMLQAELAKTLLDLSGKKDQSTVTTVFLESFLERIEWNLVQARRIYRGLSDDLRILVSEPIAHTMLFLRCTQEVDLRYRGGSEGLRPIFGGASIIDLFRSRVSDDEWKRALDGKATFVADRAIERSRQFATKLERGSRYVAPLPYRGPRFERD